MSDSCTPRPSCIGLRPPSVPVGSEAKRSVWLNWSENTARADLKPGVLWLARLLPMTAIQFSWACRPERAVKSELVILPVAGVVWSEPN